MTYTLMIISNCNPKWVEVVGEPFLYRFFFCDIHIVCRLLKRHILWPKLWELVIYNASLLFVYELSIISNYGQASLYHNKMLATLHKGAITLVYNHTKNTHLGWFSIVPLPTIFKVGTYHKSLILNLNIFWWLTIQLWTFHTNIIPRIYTLI